MESLIQSVEIPIDELEQLKKSLKRSKKAMALIEESETKFNEVRNMILDQVRKNPDIPQEYVRSQIEGLKKFIHLLLRGNLKGVLLQKTCVELGESINEINRLHNIIKQKDEEITLYRKKCEDYYNMIEDIDSKKKELEDIKNKHENAIRKIQENKFDNLIHITPNFNMSINKEENFVTFVDIHRDRLEEARKIRENSAFITYEVDKNFVDKFKEDKRSTPKLNKKDKILVTKMKI